MGRPRDTRARILGPTWVVSRGRYRVTVIAPQADGGKGRRSTRWFGDAKEASDFAEEVAAKLSRFSTTTIDQAITDYEAHLKESGTIGYGETIRRLRLFFPSLTMPIGRVTADRARSYYERFRKREHRDKPISVAYHRAALINARSLCKWAVARDLIGVNPFADVDGIGKKRRGKSQLTGDELRRLYAHCLARAEAGDASALGVLMALLMALRSGDLCRRVVRDLDLDGTVLRVEDGKTAKSNRPRHVPLILRPMLARLIEGREASEPLFPTPYTESGHHTRRWLEEAMVRLCRAAGVRYVPPHALKGAAGTVLAETGELADRIADHLSHESSRTTERHYVAPGALDDAQLGRALTVIAGGKRGGKLVR